MNPKNLVLHTASEKPRFMLVDGFGDANFIPTKTWFRFLRTRARDRKFAKLTDFLGMAWDQEKRCIVSA